MENQGQSYDRAKLIEENEKLERALALTLNKPLIKKLKDALDRINNGQYISEEAMIF